MLTIPHTISDSPSCFIDPFALIRPAHADAIAAAGAPLVVHRRDDVLDTRLPVGLFEVGMPVGLPIPIQVPPGGPFAVASCRCRRASIRACQSAQDGAGGPDALRQLPLSPPPSTLNT